MATPSHFLFVSHVSEDRAAAMEIVGELERRGVQCWITPRDVGPGKPFDDEIADAIERSQAMLLIFSNRCNESEYIRREVTVAGESQKVIIPFRIEASEPKRGLRVRLADLHWIDGFILREKAIDELVETFKPQTETVINLRSDSTSFRSSYEKKWRAYFSRPLILISAIVSIGLVIAAGIWLFRAHETFPRAPSSVAFSADEAVIRVHLRNGMMGALNVTLIWNTPDDLDLSVRCPDNSLISFKTSRVCGAILDIDSNVSSSNPSPEPVENIVWPETPTMTGQYTVYVTRYRSTVGDFATTFRVELRSRGDLVEAHLGTIAGDEPRALFTFNIPLR